MLAKELKSVLGLTVREFDKIKKSHEWEDTTLISDNCIVYVDNTSFPKIAQFESKEKLIFHLRLIYEHPEGVIWKSETDIECLIIEGHKKGFEIKVSVVLF